MTGAFNEQNAQDEAQAMREGNYDLNNQEWMRRLALADLTKRVETGGTSNSSGTGTVIQQQPFGFGSMLGGALTLA